MAYEYIPGAADKVKALVAELASMNPELIEGFMLVAVQIDGAPIVAHNACCLPHFMQALSQDMKLREDYEEVAQFCARGSYL